MYPLFCSLGEWRRTELPGPRKQTEDATQADRKRMGAPAAPCHRRKAPAKQCMTTDDTTAPVTIFTSIDELKRLGFHWS